MAARSKKYMSGGSDRRGITIHVGDYVAYNMSGQIAYGRVKTIAQSMSYGHMSWVYTIENLDGQRAPGYSRPRAESKVKNSTGLLVINQLDATSAEVSESDGESSSALEEMVQQSQHP